MHTMRLVQRPLILSCALLGIGILAMSSAHPADTWPGFRGDGSGIATGARLPERWSPQGGIAWKVSVPGYGQSAPVVWHDKVFVTSSDGPFQESLQVHAYALETGLLCWTREIKANSRVENYFRNSRAAPTCAVDANAVYSFFASGDVTALSHTGEILWSVPLMERYGEVKNERGVASSLAQSSDSLYVVIDHHGPSYIVAINKRTGEVTWKTDRGNRVPSWSSPVVTRQHGIEIVLSVTRILVHRFKLT
jgi:outer membrane protein assembly factor BamB